MKEKNDIPEQQMLPTISQKHELKPTRSVQSLPPVAYVPDALSSYLRTISKYPRLTKEEEKELGMKLKDRDEDAAIKLISGNLWLVVRIARDYERAAKSLLDLIQEGNIGLMEAVKNFDPYREVKFSSYAVWWIKAYIIRYIIANWRLVKIGTTQAQRKLFFNLKKEKDRLTSLGIVPTAATIAKNLNVKERDVIDMEQRLSNQEVSVDASHSDDDSNNLLSIMPSSVDVEEKYSRYQRNQLLKKALKKFSESLNPKERVILSKRLLSEDKATLNELSLKLEISRERVRQIENRIMDKFKIFLEKEFGREMTYFLP